MPIHLPPMSRRRFLAGSAAAAAAGLMSPDVLWAADAPADADPHRVALLSDTHICADAARLARDINMAEHLRQTIAEVAKLQPRPAHVLLNGDFALDTGEAGDYATAVELLKPAREAGMPIHIGLGNHDHRERFWAGLPSENRPDAPMKLKHVALIDTPRANWLMLDSLDITRQVRGALGEDQLKWLAATLDAHADKPALVMVHHNPELAEKEVGGGVADTTELFAVLSPRKQAKALFYGHTHAWNHKRLDDGLHLVNLPATAYVFNPEQPSGWVDARLGSKGATLELHTLDPRHPWQGRKLTMKWRK
jgi:3',5'-cyclic-AMP phosphodiesterase